MATPAVGIDGVIRLSGRIPKPDGSTSAT